MKRYVQIAKIFFLVLNQVAFGSEVDALALEKVVENVCYLTLKTGALVSAVNRHLLSVLDPANFCKIFLESFFLVIQYV